MHHHTDMIAHTTAFVTAVVEHWQEREIAQWVHPMKDRSDDLSHHERTLLPRSFISLPPRYTVNVGTYNGIRQYADKGMARWMLFTRVATPSGVHGQGTVRGSQTNGIFWVHFGVSGHCSPCQPP